ncbi:MAG: hypothetical protein FJY56_09280 [Betaproteobacteria bacterium]|nr:hypothetical protein [Betaproteobacteria bacterium]
MERNPLVVISVPDDGTRGEKLAARYERVLDTWQGAISSRIGSIVVDCDAPVLKEKFDKLGAYFLKGVESEDDIRHNYQTASGAERVARIVNKFDRFYNHDVVVNIYGHSNALDSDTISSLMWPLADYSIDIAVVAAPWEQPIDDGSTIGVDVEWSERRRIHHIVGCQVGHARNFSFDPKALKAVPPMKILPVFAYKRASLDRFLRFGPTLQELEESLEPLRAFEIGMRVGAVRRLGPPMNFAEAWREDRSAGRRP